MTATSEGPEQPDAPDAATGESLQQWASPNNTTEHNSGVQSGVFSGNYVVYNGSAESRNPPLDGPRISDEEIARAREHFVERPGFAEALATLHRNHLLFLLGKGAGRSLTSLRLLDECAVRSISRLSERRSFDSAGSDLEPGCGYIWEGLDKQWQDEITPASVDRVVAWASKHNCFVIVIVNNDVSPDLRKYAQRLGRPDPVQVAMAVLRSQHGLTPDQADEVLDSDFRERLSGDSTPTDAEFVAIRAWEVHTGKREKAEALKDVSQDPAPKRSRTVIAALFLVLTIVVVGYESVNYWIDNTTVNIASKIILLNSQNLGDSDSATAQFDVNAARRYLRLTVSAVDSDPTTGDCVSGTSLTAAPIINGNLRAAVHDQPTGEPDFNFDLDLGSGTSKANIKVTVAANDRNCKVNLSISKAELHN